MYGEKALKVSSSHRNSHVMCEAGVNGARAREWADGHEKGACERLASIRMVHFGCLPSLVG